MSKTPKTKPTIECNGCGGSVSTAFCNDCIAEDDRALESGVKTDVAEIAHEYADRRKMLGLMSPEVFAEFELFTDELEAKHG